MRRSIAFVLFAFVFLTRAASAQEVAWVQVEAHPTLRVAQQRAQDYAVALENVNGFALGGNWYGIMLGPYSRPVAQQVLRTYRNDNKIPADSFVSVTASLGQQFWPVGADVLGLGATVDSPLSVTAPAQTASPSAPAVAAPVVPDETRAQAQRSERMLSADQRKQLQIALKAGGFYTAAIDGSFGRGTRASMRAWQMAYGGDPTGILTTRQRQMLMDQYNAPLLSVGMALVRDDQAGIEMQMPGNSVEFTRYEPPFAQYDNKGDPKGARVLLISQPGTQATLFGLYDIMQTLEIVPLDGPRERANDRFTLEGRGNGIVSYTEARLIKGQIKGFTLIWPQGDEDRRTRVLSAMQDSFTRLDGVLDPGAGADTQQSLDLVAGLVVRKPRLSRSGFYIDAKGAVVTTSQVVQDCTRITLNNTYEADLLASDAPLGLAVLRPKGTLVPVTVAALRSEEPRLQSEVAVSGYSYEGILGAPTLTFGKLSDIKGLRGEPDLSRLTLAALPGDAGGPVLDAGGGVVGMLLPDTETDRRLPGDVTFAADAGAIKALLQQAGINTGNARAPALVPPNELVRVAGGMTVLVSCWD